MQACTCSDNFDTSLLQLSLFESVYFHSKMAVNYIETANTDRPAEDTVELYSKWAANYDKDMEETGLSGVKSVVEVFKKLNLDKSLHILDVGAGTGKIGFMLKDLGYKNIDCLDGCKEMLDIAKSKNIYGKYIQAIVSKEKPLPIEENSYDVAIMAGVMAPGHFGPDVFEEFIRIVKKGGIVCWAMRDPQFLYCDKSDVFQDDNFHKQVEMICNQKLWKYFVPGPIHLRHYNVSMSGSAYVMEVL